MSIAFHEELPKDSEVQCYFNANERGETSYIYCKVLYEPITEKLLSEDYEIKNVKLQKKETRSFKVEHNISMVAIEESKRYSYNDANLHENEEKDITKFASVIKSPNKKENMLSEAFNDEMALLQSKRIARNLLGRSKNSPSSKKVYYVPIAVCIETRIPYIEVAKSLLNTLISMLSRSSESRTRSYAEFSSCILTLTHITVPPPLTSLTIYIENTEIVLNEGSIGTFACSGDVSIAYLFSVLSIDHILILWSALLLEKNTIIHTDCPNVYFCVAKALTDLMFPLVWPFPKGVISNLNYLGLPTPYCFGVLGSECVSVEEVIESLEESEEECGEYILLGIGKDAVRLFSGFRENLKYPNTEKLEKKLYECCARFKFEAGARTSVKDINVCEFGLCVQKIFKDEMIALIGKFKTKIEERNDVRGLQCKLVRVELKKKAKGDEQIFLNKVKDSQALIGFYNEQYLEIQGNFARTLAMNYKNAVPGTKLLSMVIRPTSFILVARFDKFLELKSSSKKEEPKNGYEKIPLKRPFNWKREVAKMKSQITGRDELQYTMNEANAKVLVDYTRSNSSGLEDRSSESKDEDLEMDIVINETSRDEILTQLSEVSKLRQSVENVFYGHKGILSFLGEFMKSSDEHIHKEMIMEEMLDVESHLRQALMQSNAKMNKTMNSKNNPHACISLKNSWLMGERLILNFISTSRYQFELFLGYFYYRQYADSPLVLKKFLEALKCIPREGTCQSYFPVMMFKSLIRQLTLEELRAISVESKEMKKVINEVIVLKEKAIALTHKRTSMSFSEEVKKSADLPYLNSGEARMTTENPNIVLIAALKSLIGMISCYKSEGEKAFGLAKSFKDFEIIKKQAELLAVCPLLHQ